MFSQFRGNRIVHDGVILLDKLEANAVVRTCLLPICSAELGDDILGSLICLLLHYLSLRTTSSWMVR